MGNIVLSYPKPSDSFNKQLKKYISSIEISEIGLPTKLQISLWVLLLLLVFGISLINYDSFQLGTYQDDASYVILAKSIVFSEKYGLINVPDQPLPTRYPFGFPLLLAPVVWLFPNSPDILKIVSLVATLFNTSLLFWGWPYFSQRKSYWWGLAVAALFSISPTVIGQSRMVMSEPVFTTLVLISLILVEKYVINRGQNWQYSLLLGMAVGLAIFVRTLGIALFLAVLVRIFVPYRQNSLKNLIGISLGVTLLVAIVMISTPVSFIDLIPSEYVFQLNEPKHWGQDVETPLLPRFFEAVNVYAQQHIRDAIIPFGGGSREAAFATRLGFPNSPLVLGVFVTIITILGVLSFMKSSGVGLAIVLFELGYLGILLLWPWRGVRFLYPIIPFLTYQFLQGVYLSLSVLDRYKFPKRRLFSLSNLGISVFICLIFSLSIYKSVKINDSLQYVRDFRIGTGWLRENSQPDVLLMAQQPQSIYIYSKRNTIDFPSADQLPSSGSLESILQAKGIDYIIVAPYLEWRDDGVLEYDRLTSEKIIPMLEELSGNKVVRLVYQSELDLVKIYQVNNK